MCLLCVSLLFICRTRIAFTCAMLLPRFELMRLMSIIKVRKTAVFVHINGDMQWTTDRKQQKPKSTP